MFEHEIIVPHRTPIALTTNVRSTLLQSSLNVLRSHGHFDRYLELLDPGLRDAITMSLAPAWLPIECAIAHYGACDQLNLSAQELVAVGQAVGDRIQGTFLTTLTKTSRVVGVTPWTLLKHFDRLWSRLFQGGSVEIVKVGPKDMVIEIRSAASLPELEYFRVGFCGVVRAGFVLVGVRAAYVKIAHWDATNFTIHSQWA